MDFEPTLPAVSVRGRCVIVTGGGSRGFQMLVETLRSLRPALRAPDTHLVVLDFGLDERERSVLGARYGAQVVQPEWVLCGLQATRHIAELQRAVQPYLPDLVPGYDTYLWVGPGAWAQGDTFVSSFAAPAQSGALVASHQREPAYARAPGEWRKEFARRLRSYGLWPALRMQHSRAVNPGVVALRADSPVWLHWVRRYEQAVMQSGPLASVADALLATVAVDGVPTQLLGSHCHWNCRRARPMWDARKQVYCVPHAPHLPIQIMQLAPSTLGSPQARSQPSTRRSWRGLVFVD